MASYNDIQKMLEELKPQTSVSVNVISQSELAIPE